MHTQSPEGLQGSADASYAGCNPSLAGVWLLWIYQLPTFLIDRVIWNRQKEFASFRRDRLGERHGLQPHTDFLISDSPQSTK